MSEVSRRSFFKLIGGAVALAATPLKAIENVIEIPVEFGWTWKVKDNPHSEFSKIVTETLRANRAKLAENLSNNNVLLLKLKEGQKIKLNIERIDPDVQTQRMAQRMKDRLPKRNEEYPETFGYVTKLKSREEFYKNYPAFTKEDFDKRA